MKIRIKDFCVGEGESPRIMGVVNISPESFFTGSFVPAGKLVAGVAGLTAAGVDIIDIGARSTALHAPPLSVAEEKARVIAAFRELDGSDAVFSLDTMYPEVLRAALRYDLSVINDIGGLGNREYAALAGDSGLPVIAMAAHRIPGDPLNLAETHAALQEIIGRAERNGISDLILDPGIGRWVPERTGDADWELCRNFSGLRVYGYPLLAAVSRKTFIGDVTGKPAEDRLPGTLGVLYYLLGQGADIVRVHDVEAAKDIAAVFEKLQRV
jgi:dihydropteroate synthase